MKFSSAFVDLCVCADLVVQAWRLILFARPFHVINCEKQKEASDTNTFIMQKGLIAIFTFALQNVTYTQNKKIFFYPKKHSSSFIRLVCTYLWKNPLLFLTYKTVVWSRHSCQWLLLCTYRSCTYVRKRISSLLNQ